jgi:hypothetical protein
MYRHHEDEIIVSNRATTMNSFVAPLIPIMAVEHLRRSVKRELTFDAHL